jgi:putative endonuclease
MHRETLWWEAPAVLPPSFCVRTLFVYIMASSSRVLYVGVTNNIRRRVEEHRNGESDFTSRYRIRRLVYVEQLGPPIVAISREKQIKRMSRDERLRLVAGTNPEWHDLAEAWFRFPFGTSPVSVRDLRVSGKQRREKQARSQGRRLK